MVPVGRLTLVRTFAKIGNCIKAREASVAIPSLVAPMLGPVTSAA